MGVGATPSPGASPDAADNGGGPTPPLPRALDGLSLRANFSWTLLGNAYYAASQWGVLVLLAKLTSAEKVGIFALGLAICNPAIALTNLQLRQVQATDARQLYVFGDYLSLRLVTTLLALLLILAVAFLGYESARAWVIAMVGVAMAFESISDVCYGRLQQAERMDRISHSMMIKGTLSLAGLAAGIVLTRSLLCGTAGFAAGRLGVLLVYDLPMVARLARGYHASLAGPSTGGSATAEAVRLRWDPPTLIALTRLSLPLGIANMLESLRHQVPRYFIERFLGSSALGIFAAIVSTMRAVGIIVSAMGQSATPRLARLWAGSQTPAFVKLLMKLQAIGLAMGSLGVLAVVAAGRPLLTLFYTPEYAERVDVFLVVAIVTAASCVAGPFGTAIRAMRLFKPALMLMVLSSLATAASSYVLIRMYGLVGAAYALLVGMAVSVLAGGGIVMWGVRTGHTSQDTM